MRKQKKIVFQLQVVREYFINTNKWFCFHHKNFFLLASEARLSVVPEDRSKCPKCGEYFQNRGGVFFKHINQCNVIASQSKDVVSISSGEISCKKCGKIYPLNRKKHLQKHEESCAATEPSTRNSTASVSETGVPIRILI